MTSIIKGNIRNHSKASEKYIDVIFNYSLDSRLISLSLSVPIEYRRTGVSIKDNQIDNYLKKVYHEINPSDWNKWKEEQKYFWDKKNNRVTKGFFDKLTKNFEWCCVACDLPQNPNWARRIQEIKDLGYTLATDINRVCSKCNTKKTHLILLPLKRGGITGYEMWSSSLRKRIIALLKSYDVYEAKVRPKETLLPDHKFPEIRWNKNTKRNSLEKLTDKEILRDFQLFSNQRNQQKREVCRGCYQTGERGILYGIPFFYKGSKQWDQNIPRQGKKAESGCVGCGWYDLEKWRQELKNKL